MIKLYIYIIIIPIYVRLALVFCSFTLKTQIFKDDGWIWNHNHPINLDQSMMVNCSHIHFIICIKRSNCRRFLFPTWPPSHFTLTLLFVSYISMPVAQILLLPYSLLHLFHVPPAFRLLFLFFSAYRTLTRFFRRLWPEYLPVKIAPFPAISSGKSPGTSLCPRMNKIRRLYAGKTD